MLPLVQYRENLPLPAPCVAQMIGWLILGVAIENFKPEKLVF